SFSPAEHNGTSLTSPFNTQPVALDRTDGVSAYNDISPRFGIAYDVFGNGKTAIKFNIGRYLGPATNDTIYTQNNPANRIVGFNLQQELVPRVSLEVGYNRRWWNNFTITDNRAVGPNDYEKWTITAPRDPRLPNGGGYPIDVYTLTAAAAARPADNYITFETD